MKKTSLYEMHKKYGGKLIEFSGWELPLEYSGLKEEHMAVRESAGLFDVSHMGEVVVKGEETTAFIDYLVTNDVKVMEDKQVIYTFMCNESGGVVDDLLVYRFSDEKILLVVNAGNSEKNLEWIREKAGKFKVELEDISKGVSQLAIQGPEAERVLQKVVSTELSGIGFFRFEDEVEVAGVKCLISRTGYTGEDGFEIYTSNEGAPVVWESLLEGGGVVPAGLGARDTLRFEAGLPLYGNELGEDISPLEAGFGFFVKTDRGDFVGRDALVEEKNKGIQKKTVGFRLRERGIARHGYRVYSGNREIGWVTTGYQLPGNKESVGLALIEAEYAKQGSEIEVQIRKKQVKAEIISKKFLEKKYKK